ncbi:MAG TPA: lytic transglycosylase domain-containing protein [Pseudonocardia sp.]
MGRRIAAPFAALLLVAAAGCAHRSGSPGAECPPVENAAAAACRIAAADTVLHDPGAAPDARAEAGRRAQQAYAVLAVHPDWDTAVAGAVTPALRGQVALAVDADRQLNDLAGPPGVNLPSWRIIDPLPADQLRGYYSEAQRRFGVDWTVLAAINLVETRMGRVVGLSSAGAQGPMQFMPATWARYGLGGDVWNPRDAVLGAANYLAMNGAAANGAAANGAAANGAPATGVANGAADPAWLDRALHRYNNDVRYVRAVRDYAAMMAADPRAFDGVLSWPVRYRTVAGDVELPTGYRSEHPLPVAQWLATHPQPEQR